LRLSGSQIPLIQVRGLARAIAPAVGVAPDPGIDPWAGPRIDAGMGPGIDLGEC
jgi:hypothetical protein